MTGKIRALLRLTVRELSHGLSSWWPFYACFLLVEGWLFLGLDSRVERVFGNVFIFSVLLFTLTGVSDLVRSGEKRGYLWARPVSRVSTLVARLGLAMTIGVAAFGALGVATLYFGQQSTLELESFDSLRRFEAAGFTLTFEDEANRKAFEQWPAGDADEDLQVGLVQGVGSPHLVAVLVGFTLYTLWVVGALIELQRPAGWKAWRSVGHAFAVVPWLAFLALLLFRAHLIAEAIYLHPMLTTVSIGGLVLVYAVVCVWRWRRADV